MRTWSRRLSGFEDRPGGRAIYQAVTSGAVEAVIIPRYDRFSRSKWLTSYYLLQETLDKHGVTLHFTDKGIAGTDFVANILTAFDQEKGHKDLETIRTNTRSGKMKKATGYDGKPARIVGAGAAPMGYHRTFDNTLGEMVWEIDPVEKVNVQTIFELYATGLSLNKLSQELDKRGIKPATHRKGTAKKFSRSSLTNTLRNEIYAGVAYYGKSVIDENGKRVAIPKSEWVRIDVPELTIVSRDRWEQVQDRLEQNKAIRYQTNDTAKIPVHLQGFARCECGRGVTVVRGKGKPPSYRCTSSSATNGADICEHFHQGRTASGVDRYVFGKVWDAITDEDHIRQAVEKHNLETEDQAQEIQSRIDSLRKANDKIDKHVMELVTQLVNITSDALIAGINQKAEDLEQQKQANSVEIVELESRLQAPIDADELLPTIMLWTGREGVLNLVPQADNPEGDYNGTGSILSHDAERWFTMRRIKPAMFKVTQSTRAVV